MDYKLVGSSCGVHGPYTFYKAFKYSKNGKTNILAVSEFFFVKLWPDSDLISIGELILLWTDKNNEQTLASLRLYILPENTPDGRTDIHGEDEVLAISEKVVLRVDDLLTWIHVAPDWHWGQSAVWSGDAHPFPEIKEEVKEEPDKESSIKPRVDPAISTDPPLYPRHKSVDMDDVLAEKQKLGDSHWEDTPGVVVLSFARYCRYRGLLKRLEGVYNKWLRNSLIQALGGFTSPFKNTKILFCKDTFDYPELEGHELLCNHLAPKLKGKNANKRKKKEVSASEEEEETDSDSCNSSDSSASSSSNKPAVQMKAVGVKPRLRCTLEVGNRVGTSSPTIINVNTGLDGIKNTNLMDEKKFLQGLHAFMRARNTPIGRIPVVGFKEVNLYKLYRKVIQFGGYDVVTNNKMWKQVYQVTGGDMSCTSAATLSRRHYEKLLLPYERFLKGKSSTLIIPSSYSLSPQARLAQLSGSVKISPLRVGVVQSKSLVQVKTEKRGEKENIPERLKRPPEAMLSSSVTIIKKEIKEDGPVDPPPPDSTKPIVTIKAAAPVKKQKLDMLKQGGLEVTPVALSGATAFLSKVESSSNEDKTPVKKEQPKATPPPATVNIKNSNKVSITVTPDISHLSGVTASNGSGGSNGNNKVSITVTPDMSHLMYPWLNVNGPGTSKQKPPSAPNNVVYGAGSAVGLPVEAVLGGQPSSSTSSPIDLRTKVKKPNIGSNLEISLIPSGMKKSAIQNSNVRSNSRTPQRYNNPRFNAPIYTLKSSPNAAPFVPLIDPAYLCGNIVTQKLPQFTAPNPATSSTASINSYYKDLLRSQGIFNLLPDGSTSISLVGGQSTPTSK